MEILLNRDLLLNRESFNQDPTVPGRDCLAPVPNFLGGGGS